MDHNEEKKTIQVIVGQQLSSVEFVMDYVQFRFSGPTLSAYTHPTVNISNRTYSWEDLGYRDAICECITKKVISVMIQPEEYLEIAFEHGTTVRISIRKQDLEFNCAEALNFSDGPAKWFVL